MMIPKTNNELRNENEQLRLRLEEAEAVVDAIRTGIVDAVMVDSAPGESVYTLEGADRQYRRLVEAMRQGVAVLSGDGVILYCNPCLADLFGVTVEKMTGCIMDEFVVDNDRGNWSHVLQNVANIATQKEVQLRRVNGTTFPASITISKLTMRVVCLLVTDLSQQKLYDDLVASKAKLRYSEIRFRRLFETAKDGILILDTETGKITDANPFMSELLGYPLEYFSGKELWEVGLFSDKSANEAAVRALQESGYIRYEHLPLKTSDGRRVEVEIVANSYHEDDHSVIQCNIRDMTERSEMELERDRLEAQMREQAAVLKDLHRRKDEFLAMLSHELRNPLSPIASALQLLGLQKNEGTLQLKARKIIERQVGQLTRLVDDLLEVSRITSGTIHLQCERIALKGILENAVETVRPLMARREHKLIVSISLEPIWIFADAARLEQVIVNLLTNAAKFTDEHGRITLTAACEDRECVLRVRDSGVGISPELLPHVFELFTQAERSLDRSQGGLGIGLALVQRLVEMLDGRVEAHSTLGEGSEFVVRLPLMGERELELPSPDIDTAARDGSALRIMVVDDNVDAAQMLGMLLEEFGHQVLALHEGSTTLLAALDFLPDVVLLDIGLPGMDGYEIARRMRGQHVLEKVVLVAMTGYGNESDVKRSQDAGFNHHLVKPPDFDRLTEILLDVAKTKQGC